MHSLRLMTAAATVALSLSLAGPAAAQTAAPQGTDSQGTDSQGTDSQGAGAANVDPSLVVARIGDQEVTLGQIIAMRSQLPAQYQQMPLEVIFEPMLNRAIDQILITRAARDSGLADRDDVKARVQEAADQVVAEVYLTETIASEVSEEALRARYQESIAGQSGEEEARARHILLESEDDARAVIDELDGGADFGGLAEQKSTGPSAAKGGDLGWFKAGQMVPEFSAAAFALEPGTYTADPVRSDFGWHVILLEEKRVADAPPFEQMQEQLAAEMTRELIQQRLTDLRGAAEIERFGPTGQPLPAPE